jgi:hypothetical protein
MEWIEAYAGPLLNFETISTGARTPIFSARRRLQVAIQGESNAIQQFSDAIQRF